MTTRPHKHRWSLPFDAIKEFVEAEEALRRDEKKARPVLFSMVNDRRDRAWKALKKLVRKQ